MTTVTAQIIDAAQRAIREREAREAAQAASLHQSTVTADAGTLTLTSIGDLLAEPEETIDWLVENLIPAGGTVVIAAKPKVGKSTSARDLALAVARGDTWLGHRCHAGPVWYFDFEGRRRDIRAHFRQMGARPSDPLRVFVGQAPANVVAQVRRLAEAERPTGIIVDTMQRFVRATSTDDYAEMTRLLDEVIAIARSSGATMILLHHSGKADRASLDQVLGSTAITGSADTIILMSRTERYRTISTVQRVGDDLPETLILLDENTGRVSLGGSRQDAEQRIVGDSILAALSNATEPLTEPQLEELVDARTTVKRRALRDLVRREQALRTGRGGKGDPYRYSVIHSCSLVPPIGWEQENNNPRSQGSFNAATQNACSRVPAQELVPENENEGEDDDADHM
jgi:KaiC/GvpD/RAD55 family RecA-like ATPase